MHLRLQAAGPVLTQGLDDPQRPRYSTKVLHDIPEEQGNEQACRRRLSRIDWLSSKDHYTGQSCGCGC